ncbi:hypothetical protein FOA43_000916 [Brettanomyces nanus]|uniref:Uncharacterized protein n=1 Tax=Eeniella nana TaxID=13502 RepID=A0A875S2N7_EENNA|nr:uncharacterized protein FOA43_000916 [Brettanomyces nanus]QPG73604.1 hypothetical protein FOA43_000916 [Brettanomyces nanus]
MSTGSSRYLIRHLEEEFGAPSSKILNSLLEDNPQLTDAIDSYLQKHDTYDSNDNAKLGNELYRVYMKYILNDYSKEKYFLQVLTKLIHCIVDDNEFLMWIKKYITSSTDSAGLNNSFVELTKRLINNALSDSISTKDIKLQKTRSHHSELVLNLLLDSYFRKIEKADIIDDSGSSALSSQEQEEKSRFRRLNIRLLISNYASAYTKEFLVTMSDYLHRNGNLKLEVMSLLSSVLKEQPMKLYTIIEIDLYDDLLECMLKDPSIDVVDSTINVFCMILPHICNKLQRSLLKIFAIFARRLCWQRGDLGDLWTEGKAQLSLQRLLKANAFSIPPMRLEDYLYGLYPLNLFSFCKDPLKYMGAEYVQYLPPGFDADQFKALALPTLTRFLLHENFIKFSTPEEEFEDIKRFSALGYADAIALYCAQLDPLIDEVEKSRRSGRSTSTGESISTRNSGPIPSPPGFRIPDFGNTFQARKASIISIGSTMNAGGNQDPLLIGSTNEQRVLSSDNLLDVHKDLYFSNKDSLVRRQSLISDSGIAQVVASGSQPSESGSGTESGSEGAIDFYQRELMILINELDFAEYVRNLSIFNYRKARKEILKLYTTVQEFEILKKRNEQLTREIGQIREVVILKEEAEKTLRMGTAERLELLLKKNKLLNKQLTEITRSEFKLQEKYEKLEADHKEAKNKLRVHEKEFMSLKDKVSLLGKEKNNLTAQIDLHSQKSMTEYHIETVDDKDKEIFILNEEIKRYKYELDDAIEKLKKMDSHATQRENGDQDLRKTGEALKKYIALYQTTLTDYEQTIKDLETEVQTKELTISKLNTTQPINIPANGSSDVLVNKMPQFTYESSYDVFGNRMMRNSPSELRYGTQGSSIRSASKTALNTDQGKDTQESPTL